MILATKPQSDQQSRRWDSHVAVYEAVVGPLRSAFARSVLVSGCVGQSPRGRRCREGYAAVIAARLGAAQECGNGYLFLTRRTLPWDTAAARGGEARLERRALGGGGDARERRGKPHLGEVPCHAIHSPTSGNS